MHDLATKIENAYYNMQVVIDHLTLLDKQLVTLSNMWLKG